MGKGFFNVMKLVRAQYPFAVTRLPSSRHCLSLKRCWLCLQPHHGSKPGRYSLVRWFCLRIFSFLCYTNIYCEGPAYPREAGTSSELACWSGYRFWRCHGKHLWSVLSWVALTTTNWLLSLPCAAAFCSFGVFPSLWLVTELVSLVRSGGGEHSVTCLAASKRWCFNMWWSYLRC